MENKKNNVSNFLEVQWVRGKEAPADCDHPPIAIQKRGYAAMYYERCEICGNRWERILLNMVARDSKTTRNNHMLSSTGKRPDKIERFFLSTDTGA